ncbi:hypothetical protein GGH95_002479, partial [Coemansia sp. RSA 1836]
MGLPSQQRSAARPVSRAASARVALAATRPSSAAAQRNPARKLNAPALLKAVQSANETATNKQAATKGSKKVDLSWVAARVDLASNIGMAISSDVDAEQSGCDLIPAVNALYLQNIDADDFGSDDELCESEETQAANMRSALLDRMAAIDKELGEERLDADRRDYEANSQVLDHRLVTKKLDMLASFAQHLRKVGKNRASLLARLAEPLTEEHWLLDAGSHQQMVDAMRGMCDLVNHLPTIAAAANHCLTVDLPEEPRAGEGDATIQAEARSSGRYRQLAQMEKLVHK